jgi:hypothetical protein
MIKGFHLDDAAKNVFYFTFKNCVLCYLSASFLFSMKGLDERLPHKDWVPAPIVLFVFVEVIAFSFIRMQTQC